MARKVKYLVIPFRMINRRLQPGEARSPSTEDAAMRLAEAMAARFAGVAAIEVHVDNETGEMMDPRELVVYGAIPEGLLDEAA